MNTDQAGAASRIPSSTNLPMHDPVSSAHVLARLDRLERENRRYKRAASASGALLFVWAACSVAPQVENVVTAERFVLLAADGSEKAALELDSKGNAMLTLQNGQARAVVTTNGPSVLLRGPDGKTGAFMGIDTKNTSRLELTSHRLLDGVRLTTHEDGSAGVYVLDADGRKRGAFESLSSGGSGINFQDARGRMRGHFGVDPGSVPNLLLLDEDGLRRFGTILQDDGQALLEMNDEQGRPRVQLATLFDGSPRLEFKGEDGAAIFQAP